VDVWGTGKPVREWIHIDDGAEAMIRGIKAPATEDFINVGIGIGVSVLELCELIKELSGYQGALKLDPSKPDGAPFKTVDGEKGEQLLGWKPSIPFREGVAETIRWYEKNYQYQHQYV
jgi:GDP-L-fucose synthase